MSPPYLLAAKWEETLHLQRKTSPSPFRLVGTHRPGRVSISITAAARSICWGRWSHTERNPSGTDLPAMGAPPGPWWRPGEGVQNAATVRVRSRVGFFERPDPGEGRGERGMGWGVVCFLLWGQSDCDSAWNRLNDQSFYVLSPRSLESSACHEPSCDELHFWGSQ